jgi:hypothetical protein
VRLQPARVDSGLCRCPRVVVPTWWEWNDRSGSEELTGSPGGYSEPFPRSGTTISNGRPSREPPEGCYMIATLHTGMLR